MIFCLDSPICGPLVAVLSGALVSMAVGIPGCARPTAPTAASPQESAPPPVKDFGVKPSETEAKEFAKELIAAIESNDINKFNLLVDWTALLNQATSGIDVPAGWRQGFYSGFLASLAKPGGLFERLATAQKSGGSLRLLHVHDAKSRPRALIRSIGAGSEVNYLDFELVRRPDGQIRAVDFYSFTSGERISKTIRRLYLPAAANQSRNIFEKLLTSESDLVKASPKIADLNGAIRNGQPKEALVIYESLPPGAQKEKAIMLLRLQAAQASSDDALHLAAIDDLAKTFPGDPGVDLITIDAFVIRKEYDKAFAGLHRLEKRVGGDPYLKVLQANIRVEQGKHDEAAKLAQIALDAEPTLRGAHYTRLGIANGQKKYSDMARFLSEYEAAFHEAIEGIETAPEYAAFVASAEYKKYKDQTDKK
jgi:tetratricopeptide (TPR) repeat protein